MTNISGDSPIKPSVGRSFFSMPSQGTLRDLGTGAIFVGLTAFGASRSGKRLNRTTRSVVQKGVRALGSRKFTPIRTEALVQKTFMAEHWALAAAKQGKLPENFVKSDSYINMRDSLIEELNLIQAQFIAQAAGKARFGKIVKNTPKGVAFLKLATTIAIATYLIYGTESGTATMLHLKQYLNKKIKAIHEKGNVFEKAYNEKISKEEEQLKEILINKYNKLIEQLPEEDRKNFIEERDQFIKNIKDAIGDNTSKFAELVKLMKTLPEQEILSADEMTDKIYQSKISTILTGFTIAMSVGNFSSAKKAIDVLIQMGLPEKVVKKMVIQVTKVGATEAVRSSTNQSVSHKKVRHLTGEILKHFNFSPDQVIEMSKEENKIANSLANMLIHTLARLASTITKSPVAGELIEQATSMSMRKGTADLVEQPLTIEETEESIDKHLKPVEDNLKRMEAFINGYDIYSAERIKKADRLLSALQNKVDTLAKAKLSPKQRISEFYSKMSQITGGASIFHFLGKGNKS
ncbi:MAG: hypothetical protein H0W88_08145 [Parachlamydiaceae bacterium]|nr:hypothetical protein [Parachlamydiaceae bacterium]